MRQLPELKADCAHCAALCCVALAFDKSEMFAFDKPAGTPCTRLAEDDSCTIHGQLHEMGYAGCARYECLGAGQRVVQQLFEGRSWRTDPDLAKPMFEAFRIMRDIHELLALLDRAKHLPLEENQARSVDAFLAELLPAQEWTLEMLEAFDRSDLSSRVRAFLPGLRKVALAISLDGSDERPQMLEPVSKAS